MRLDRAAQLPSVPLRSWVGGAGGEARILTQAACLTDWTPASRWIRRLSLPFRGCDDGAPGRPVDAQPALRCDMQGGHPRKEDVRKLTGLRPALTCAPGVAEVALDHAAGLAVPAAHPASVLFGRRADDAVAADFLQDQRAGSAWFPSHKGLSRGDSSQT